MGGAVIVIRRVGTNESYVDDIPLELFKEDEFKYKTYLRRATQIILEGLDKLDVSEDEPIFICTGFILSQAKEALMDLGYDVNTTKITGATQKLAEHEFVKHLVRLGVGDFEMVKGMRSFNGFLSWVKEDLNREIFVKTGWSRWPQLKESIS